MDLPAVTCPGQGILELLKRHAASGFHNTMNRTILPESKVQA